MPFSGRNKIVSGTTLLLIAAPLAAILYWGFLDDPLPIKEVLLADQQKISDDDTPRDGRRRVTERDSFLIERRLCAARDVEVEVLRTMTDGVVYTIPNSHARISKGCHTRKSYVPVPSSLPPNVWFKYDFAFKACNPIRCKTMYLVPYYVAFEGQWPPQRVSPPEVAPNP